MTTLIQDQIEAALDALKRSFAEKTGSRDVHVHFSAKISAYQAKPEITLSLQDGWTSQRSAVVNVYTHHLGKTPTIDAAFALAAQRIAELRTYADECADLGIEPARAPQIGEAA